MQISKTLARGFMALAAIVATPHLAHAAELKIFAPRAIATVLEKVGPAFEKSSGQRLNIIVDLTPTLVTRVRKGEAVDGIVALPALIDALIAEGLVLPDSRTPLVRSGLGVELRKGAPQPDVSTVDAFKRAMLAARSVAYLKTPAGVHLDQVFQRLGIADAIGKKATRPDADVVSKLVANGDIELGIVVTTQILTTPGVELAGRLPPEVNYYVAFVGGISSKAAAPDGARALLAYLTRPTAVQVITDQGMNAGG